MKDVGGVAATNPITIIAEGETTIDHAGKQKIVTNYGSTTLIPNNKNWVAYKDTETVSVNPVEDQTAQQTQMTSIQNRVDFNFLSANTVKIATVAKNKTVLSATIVVDTAFDDNGSTISLGTNSDLGAIFSTAQTSLAFQATYRSEEHLLMTSTEDIILSLNPSNSTVGSGYVVVITT